MSKKDYARLLEDQDPEEGDSFLDNIAQKQSEQVLDSCKDSWLAPQLRSATCVLSWILNGMLVVALTWSLTRDMATVRDLSQGIYSPAQEAVEYKNVVFHRGFQEDLSPYQGWPDDEKDRLWEEMYNKGVSLHIDAVSNRRLPNQTERMPEPGYESEYMVGLDVFHQLHCLNMIRQGFYPQRYNSAIRRADGRVDYMSWLHIDHCIESLRQSLVCHADVSTLWYKWLPRAKYMMPRLDITHTCRNFSKIQEWAWARFVNTTNKKTRVDEDGRIVDYAGLGSNPGEHFQIPNGWEQMTAQGAV